jgi:hypothetical protein
MRFLKRVIPSREDGEGPRRNVETLKRYIVRTLSFSTLTLPRFNDSKDSQFHANCATRDDIGVVFTRMAIILQ